MKRLALVLLLNLAASLAHAHKPSDSYLTLQVEGNSVHGQWDIALRDLDYAIGIDRNDDGSIDWGELRGRYPELSAYALSHLQIAANGTECRSKAGGLLVDDHTDGKYAVLRFVAECDSVPQALDLGYRLFFDLDPQHRGLLRLQHDGRTDTAVFAPDASKVSLRLAEPRNGWREFVDFVREGIWHIWIGYDHILFLLSLLLPAVFQRRGGRWEPVAGFRPALVEVVKIVTAFTLAHSITLSLAALGLIDLPSRWVESLIALSVVLASLNNLSPLFQGRRWGVAFGFGLIHGLGFASVLGDLGLPQGSLLPALFGFNVGVEVGQLAIVSAFLPMAFTLRNSLFYRRYAFNLGSAAIATIAAVWLVERSFDLKLFDAL